MFGNDYVFTNHPSTEEGMIEMLKENSFDSDQIDGFMEAINETSGAYCIFMTRENAIDIPNIEVPHYMKRLIPPIGHSVVVLNLAGLTAEEELAIAAHEFGHVYCGHKVDDENALICELEADWFAIVSVGAKHLYSAMIKLMVKFDIDDNSIIDKRLEVIRQYL